MYESQKREDTGLLVVATSCLAVFALFMFLVTHSSPSGGLSAVVFLTIGCTLVPVAVLLWCVSYRTLRESDHEINAYLGYYNTLNHTFSALIHTLVWQKRHERTRKRGSGGDLVGQVLAELLRTVTRNAPKRAVGRLVHDLRAQAVTPEFDHLPTIRATLQELATQIEQGERVDGEFRTLVAQDLREIAEKLRQRVRTA